MDISSGNGGVSSDDERTAKKPPKKRTVDREPEQKAPARARPFVMELQSASARAKYHRKAVTFFNKASAAEESAEPKKVYVLLARLNAKHWKNRSG